jgi:predicted nuclease with RNAse H fold
MCARPGGLVGVADSPNFSTHCLFMFEEMTVETLKDVNNRKQTISVVENYAPVTVAPVSGVLFHGAA